MFLRRSTLDWCLVIRALSQRRGASIGWFRSMLNFHSAISIPASGEAKTTPIHCLQSLVCVTLQARNEGLKAASRDVLSQAGCFLSSGEIGRSSSRSSAI